MLGDLQDPELISVHAWAERSQVVTFVMHSDHLELPPEMLRDWIVERIGVGVRTLSWEEFDGGYVLRRGRGHWVLCEHEIARAVLELSRDLGPEELTAASTYGRDWARAAGGLRRAERHRGSIGLQLHNDTLALTELWGGLPPEVAEVVVGLSQEWEGDARSLCEAAAGAVADTGRGRESSTGSGACDARGTGSGGSGDTEAPFASPPPG